MSIDLEIVTQPGFPTKKVRGALSQAVADYISQVDKASEIKDVKYEMNDRKDSVVLASFESNPEGIFDSPEFFKYILNSLTPFDMQALRTGKFVKMW